MRYNQRVGLARGKDQPNLSTCSDTDPQTFACTYVKWNLWAQSCQQVHDLPVKTEELCDQIWQSETFGSGSSFVMSVIFTDTCAGIVVQRPTGIAGIAMQRPMHIPHIGLPTPAW